MKQGIVKFSKEFVTETGLKEWAGIELPFNEERESGVDALRRAETIVNVYQQSKGYIMNHEGAHPAQIAPERTTEGQRIANLISELYACTELEGDDGLLSYKNPASQNRETQNIFDIMFKKLSVNAG